MSERARPMFRRIGFRAFLADARGAGAIELVIWIPFFFTLFFAIVDMSILFYRYTQMWDATRDVARQWALRQIDTEEEALARFNQLVGGHSYTLEVNVDTSQVASLVTVTVTGNTQSMSIFGFFSAVSDGLQSRVSFSMETEGT